MTAQTGGSPATAKPAPALSHLFPMSTYDRIRAAEVKVGDLLLGPYFGVAAVVVDVQDGINGATRITYTAEAGRISPHPAAATRDYPADAMVERMTP